MFFLFAIPSRTNLFASFYIDGIIRLSALVASGAAPRPPDPLRQGLDPAPASVGFAALAWQYERCVPRLSMRPASSAEHRTFLRSFVRCDSLRSTPGGCFPQRSLSAPHRVQLSQLGRFCGTFSAAPARFFTSAPVFTRSRPAKGCSPFDPRQGLDPAPAPTRLLRRIRAYAPRADLHQKTGFYKPQKTLHSNANCARRRSTWSPPASRSCAIPPPPPDPDRYRSPTDRSDTAPRR